GNSTSEGEEGDADVVREDLAGEARAHRARQPEIGSVRPRLRHRVVRPGCQPAGAAGIAVCPDARADGAPAEEHCRDQEREPPLSDGNPVVARDEAEQRLAARRRVVDEVARASDALLEGDRRRVAREPAAGERKVRRCGAVEKPQPANAGGAELLGPSSRLTGELVELGPSGGSLALESV